MSYYKLPVGYRFCPTEEQLLSFFLRNKAMGLQPPQYGVIEANLYTDQATPWILLKEDSTNAWQPVVDSLAKVHRAKKVIYVITKLSNLVDNGKRKARKAGCGTWHGNTVTKNIRNSRGQLIGKKRTLTFESDSETVGQWNMDEYELDGVSLEGIANNDHVICRIKRDDTKSSKGGRLVVSNDNNLICSGDQHNNGIVQVHDDNSGTDNFEGLGKRKAQLEEEEISHGGNKMYRMNNNYLEKSSNSTAKMASEINATVSEIQNVFEGENMDGTAANVQGNNTLPFHDSEGIDDNNFTDWLKETLDDDNFTDWLKETICFDN